MSREFSLKQKTKKELINCCLTAEKALEIACQRLAEITDANPVKIFCIFMDEADKELEKKHHN